MKGFGGISKQGLGKGLGEVFNEMKDDGKNPSDCGKRDPFGFLFSEF